MNTNPELLDYSQTDIKNLYTSGSIVPNIDTYGNLVIQNAVGQMYSSSITIPFANVVFVPAKVETKNDTTFKEL